MADIPIGTPVRVKTSTTTFTGTLEERLSVPGCVRIRLPDGSAIAVHVSQIERDDSCATPVAAQAPTATYSCIRRCGDSSTHVNGPYVCWSCRQSEGG